MRMITEHINNTIAERQKRQKAIEAELKNGSYQIGTVEAEFKNDLFILKNNIPFDAEIFAGCMDLETSAEMIYFLEHVLKHQK